MVVVAPVVSEGGPQEVDATALQCDDHMDMASFHAFPLVVVARGPRMADYGYGRGVEDALQSSVVARGLVQVAGAAAESPGTTVPDLVVVP